MHLAQSFKTKLKQKKSKLVNENKSYPKWNENKRRERWGSIHNFLLFPVLLTNGISDHHNVSEKQNKKKKRTEIKKN